MIELESEQWHDLRWAADAIDGNGDDGDNLYAAIEIARCISSASATSAIKLAADLILAKPIGSTTSVNASAACEKYPPRPRSVGGGGGGGGGVR